MLPLLPLLGLLAADPFDYDHKAPLDIRVEKTEARDGALIEDASYRNTQGGRTAAFRVRPAHAPRRKLAGILFVHWYEPKSPDSNRTQFLKQAVELAPGAESLLIDTMWSNPEWFQNRDSSQDFNASIQQVRELRRALDVLLSRPEVDRKRVAYVGHDFGAMYGAVMAGVDRRVSAWALQAGTTSFSDWFLFYPKLEAEAREKFIARMAVLDPVRFIGKAAPAPVLFQFGRQDRYVPLPKAQMFFDAAREPKQVLYYDAGHGLNDQAIADRMAWLRKQLHIE